MHLCDYDLSQYAEYYFPCPFNFFICLLLARDKQDEWARLVDLLHQLWGSGTWTLVFTHYNVCVNPSTTARPPTLFRYYYLDFTVPGWLFEIETVITWHLISCLKCGGGWLAWAWVTAWQSRRAVQASGSAVPPSRCCCASSLSFFLLLKPSQPVIGLTSIVDQFYLSRILYK